MDQTKLKCIAFEGSRRIACGPLGEVAVKIKEVCDAHPLSRIMVFDALTSEPVEFDCRGSTARLTSRIASTDRAPSPPAEPPPRTTPAGPGRPRLGVVAREVTLLPRHWEWLSTQPGGASVALRKLVEQAKRSSASVDRRRQSQNATFLFMSAMAGNLEGFEDAARALFAADLACFDALLAGWPRDISEHLKELAEAAFEPATAEDTPHA